MRADSMEDLRQALNAKRELRTQVNPGAEFEAVVSVNAAALNTVGQFESLLETALDAGYRFPDTLLSQVRIERRPIIGARRGVRTTALRGVTARHPGECAAADAEVVHLAPHFAAPLAPWLRRVAGQHTIHTRPCFLLPPFHCRSGEAGCGSSRVAGWQVTDAHVLGRRGVALNFQGERGDHLTAFLDAHSLRVLSLVQGDLQFDQFPELQRRLRARGRDLLWVMNGGMYMEDRRALGLLISDGRELARLNTRGGTGNFYLQPNGVFAVHSNDVASIASTSEYADTPAPLQATQSGPLLVFDGKINPLLNPDSTSRFVRNGVCLTANEVVLDITTSRVSLYEFASFFRALGCRNALYLDGNVSSVYAPGAGRRDSGRGLGPVIAATEARAP
jgi:uncharacterized protein YigE (DUF2233 family)